MVVGFILYTTASTSNQIDNACSSATGKRLFTQHFITCETAASLQGGAS